MSSMRVPINTPLVNIPQDRGGRRYDLNMGAAPQHEASSAMAFGGATAVGYGALERGLDDASRVLTGISLDRRRREDETLALEAYNQLNERVGRFFYGNGEPESGLYNRKGAAVLGAVKDTREFFEKNVAELSGNLTANAAEAFTARANALRFDEQRKVAVFESNGREKWRFDTYKAGAAGEMRATLDNFDTPRLREDALLRGTEHVRNLALMNGEPPAMVARRERAYQAEVMAAGINQLLAEGNFNAAMAAAAHPSFNEAQRREMVRQAAAGDFAATVAAYKNSGDLEGLYLAEAAASGRAAEEFARFSPGGDVGFNAGELTDFNAGAGEGLAGGSFNAGTGAAGVIPAGGSADAIPRPAEQEALAGDAASGLTPPSLNAASAANPAAASDLRIPPLNGGGNASSAGGSPTQGEALAGSAMPGLTLLSPQGAGDADPAVAASLNADGVASPAALTSTSTPTSTPTPTPFMDPQALAGYGALEPEARLRLDLACMEPEERLKSRQVLTDLIRQEHLAGAYARVADLPPGAALEIMDNEDFKQAFRLAEADVGELKDRYTTKLRHDRAVERTARDDYELKVGAEALDLALGGPEQAADPVRARQLLLDSDLDGHTKSKALAALTAGGLNKADDPVHVDDLRARLLAANGEVPDAEIMRGVLTGQLTRSGLDDLLKFKSRAQGPYKDLIANAHQVIDETLGKSAWADANPALPQARCKAKHELDLAVQQGLEAGDILALLDPTSPKYALPGILQRNQVSTRDQVRAHLARLQQNADSAAQGARARAAQVKAAGTETAGKRAAGKPLARREAEPKAGKTAAAAAPREFEESIDDYFFRYRQTHGESANG